MDTYKKWNVGLSIATAVIAAGVWFYWSSVCGGHKCSYSLIEGTLRPVLWSATSLSLIFLSLLVLSSSFFKKWLLHIASWSIPLSLYFILDQDPRYSGPFGIDRGDISWTFGTLVFLLTVLYALWWHIYEWRKGRVMVRDFAKLSVFFIASAVFYTIWQLF